MNKYKESLTRVNQDLEVRKQILLNNKKIILPKSPHSYKDFWINYSNMNNKENNLNGVKLLFVYSDGELMPYPSLLKQECILFSGGVESTYISLLYPHVKKVTYNYPAEVHPRAGEMFIRARGDRYNLVYYGGDEREWYQSEDGRMIDPTTNNVIGAHFFEFTKEAKLLWLDYLELRIVCPVSHLYKDEILRYIYDKDKDAYASIHSCWIQKNGWCGYCDKCLIVGAIIEALNLPPLFKMKPSKYSEAIKHELESYKKGYYDTFWRLPLFKRLHDVYNYRLTV